MGIIIVFVLESGKTGEHACLSVMAVHKGVVTGKIRLTAAVDKYGSIEGETLVRQGIQILFVVFSLHDRIVDRSFFTIDPADDFLIDPFKLIEINADRRPFCRKGHFSMIRCRFQDRCCCVLLQCPCRFR